MIESVDLGIREDLVTLDKEVCQIQRAILLSVIKVSILTGLWLSPFLALALLNSITG